MPIEWIAIKLKALLEAASLRDQVVKALHQIVTGSYRNITQLATAMWLRHPVLREFDAVDNTDVPFDPLYTTPAFHEHVSFHNPDTAYRAVAIAYWKYGSDHYIRLLSDTTANDMWQTVESWYWRSETGETP